MKQGFNPYLPSWEYIPDGEPHVFGDRVYVYGSHDRFNGYSYCLNDYVCYSAPVSDLTDWRYEGVIYGRGDDPRNAHGDACLYAPDVCRGVDGRYYLYYVLDEEDIVSVAVSDTPAGRYKFYGYVHDVRGGILGEREGDEPQFDPGVLCEDGKCYLYTGFCMPMGKDRHGPMVTVLGPDMLTIVEEPRFIAPSAPYSAGSGYEGHEFFEASSLRKVNGKYYFIYSSVQGHELCYAISDSPVEGFAYGGVLVSNVDKGIDSNKPAEMLIACPDNNHGSIEQIAGKWYAFYHRHTNNHGFSRQGCIEPIEFRADGTIVQPEITSCGPNGGPLRGEGTYPAYIACNFIFDAPESARRVMPGKRRSPDFPYVTQDGRDGDEIPGYVANIESGVAVGFKYFACKDTVLTAVRTRGYSFNGALEVLTAWDGEPLGTIPIGRANEWKTWKTEIALPDGVQALYFRYKGFGCTNILDFTLEKR